MSSHLPFPVGLPVLWVDRVGGGGGSRGGGWLVSVLCRGRGRRSGGVYVEEIPRSEIKCYQYLSSMIKCAHVLSAPVSSTPGMMNWKL